MKCFFYTWYISQDNINCIKPIRFGSKHEAQHQFNSCELSLKIVLILSINADKTKVWYFGGRRETSTRKLLLSSHHRPLTHCPSHAPLATELYWPQLESRVSNNSFAQATRVRCLHAWVPWLPRMRWTNNLLLGCQVAAVAPLESNNNQAASNYYSRVKAIGTKGPIQRWLCLRLAEHRPMCAPSSATWLVYEQYSNQVKSIQN